jgi:hypothetical protein
MHAKQRRRPDRPRYHRPLALAGIVLVAALAGAGCKATGGGYIPSNNGAKKATFGFVWQTTEDPDKYLAQGSWVDGSVRFKLKGGTFLTFPNECGTGMGTYVSTNKAYPGSGDLLMTVCDYGEPGPSNGDTICVVTLGGPFAYSNAGELRGGNLQVS